MARASTRSTPSCRTARGALYPFLLDGVATVAALNQADGLHPNAAGVEAVVERILPSVLCLARMSGHPAAAAMPPATERADCVAGRPRRN